MQSGAVVFTHGRPEPRRFIFQYEIQLPEQRVRIIPLVNKVFFSADQEERPAVNEMPSVQIRHQNHPRRAQIARLVYMHILALFHGPAEFKDASVLEWIGDEGRGRTWLTGIVCPNKRIDPEQRITLTGKPNQIRIVLRRRASIYQGFAPVQIDEQILALRAQDFGRVDRRFLLTPCAPLFRLGVLLN